MINWEKNERNMDTITLFKQILWMDISNDSCQSIGTREKENRIRE